MGEVKPHSSRIPFIWSLFFFKLQILKTTINLIASHVASESHVPAVIPLLFVPGVPSGYFCSQTGYFLPKIWASGYFLKIKSSQTISGYFGYFLKIITNMRKVWDFFNNLPQILVTNTNQVKNLRLRHSFKSKLALISSPLTNILNTKNLEKEFLNISGKIFVNKNAIKSNISGCRG